MTTVSPQRICGPCTACCTAMRVAELKKPCMVACGDVSPSGCTIYPTRPGGCRTFQCLWLAGEFADEHRPDRTGLVPTASQDGTFLTLFPVDPDAPHRPAAGSFLAWLADRGVGVVVAVGERMFAAGPREFLDRVRGGACAGSTHDGVRD